MSLRLVPYEACLFDIYQLDKMVFFLRRILKKMFHRQVANKLLGFYRVNHP